jgi:solute carrier family 50 protein (sugar transporter)
MALDPETASALQRVMGPIGAVLACVMYMSSVPVARDIISRKTVVIGDGEGPNRMTYSYFPYLTQICNTALWSAYAFNNYQDGKMFWPLFCNVYGLAFVTFVFSIYFNYCDREGKKEMLQQASPPLFIVAVICTYVTCVHTSSVVEMTGTMCMVINIIMYAGPLDGMVTAWQHKTTDSLPLSLGVSSLICSTPWFFYGFAISNPNIYVPNSIGLVVSAAQILVYVVLSAREPPSPREEVLTEFAEEHAERVRTMRMAKLQRTASMGNLIWVKNELSELQELFANRPRIERRMTHDGADLERQLQGRQLASALPRIMSAPGSVVRPHRPTHTPNGHLANIAEVEPSFVRPDLQPDPLRVSPKNVLQTSPKERAQPKRPV